MTTLPTYTCNRCTHEWVPRTNDRPKQCPACHSPYWDKPRVREAGAMSDTRRGWYWQEAALYLNAEQMDRLRALADSELRRVMLYQNAADQWDFSVRVDRTSVPAEPHANLTALRVLVESEHDNARP